MDGQQVDDLEWRDLSNGRKRLELTDERELLDRREQLEVMDGLTAGVDKRELPDESWPTGAEGRDLADNSLTAEWWRHRERVLGRENLWEEREFF